MQGPGGRDHHLGGDAAEVGALAPDQALVDGDDVQALAGQQECGVLTTRAQADHHDIALDRIAHAIRKPGRAWPDHPGG